MVVDCPREETRETALTTTLEQDSNEQELQDVSKFFKEYYEMMEQYGVTHNNR